MAGMIRASRRSTKQSSIIRQNGDIIIVKGGKIVSIRRQPGDLDLLPPLYLGGDPRFSPLGTSLPLFFILGWTRTAGMVTVVFAV
nr:hypothetical protein BaRGS_025718 [Batillaria attramentaria]